MQDAFNLGWKIANVVNGVCDRSVLKTYQSERRRVAQDLIDFDHRFSRLFSGRPAKDVMDEEGISMAGFKDAFVKGNMFASGIAVDYGASMVVAKEGDSTEQGDGTEVLGSAQTRVISKQELATEVLVGKRMPSFKVLNQADARPWHFQELLKSNGQWRLVVFAGDVKDSAQKKKLEKLGEHLGAPGSFLRRFTPAKWKYDSVIELLSVHSAKRQETTIFDFPEAFRPWSSEDGWDYWKIHADDQSYHEGFGDAYKNYGIDRTKGCSIILRPDQYVSWVGDMDDYESMDKFFSGFMIEQERSQVNGEGDGKQILDSPYRKEEYSGLANGVKATDEAVKGAGGM